VLDRGNGAAFHIREVLAPRYRCRSAIYIENRENTAAGQLMTPFSLYKSRLYGKSDGEAGRYGEKIDLAG
jgi:hypothetical protein